MTFKRVWLSPWVQAVALLLVLAGLAWCIVWGRAAFGLPLGVAAAGLVYGQVRRQRRLRQEVQRFTEAVRYRDFSQYFATRDMSPDLRAVRASFNEIIGSFKAISRERETQHHYLQNVLELVDTGILSYEPATGQVLWANDALKKQLQLPYVKSMRGLERRYPALAQRLEQLKPGEREVIALQPGKTALRLLLSATLFQTEGRHYKLIACQNISTAMDETEARAWQQLLSVMTHEIMNSVAPIASLAQTLHLRLEAGPPGEDEGLMEDLCLGIETIQRRSAGLMKFAGTYRSMSSIATADLRPVAVWELFDAVHRLMQPTLTEKGIVLDVLLPDPALTLQADAALIEQVLINLLLNAIEAVRDVPEPRIVLSAAAAEEDHVEVKLQDNGRGMAADVLENIFVPFFTTKKNGSGIGLSLCKQIMLLHRGSIRARSEEHTGSVFTLVFHAG